MPSDQPHQPSDVRPVRRAIHAPADALTEPIRVENTLWTAADPRAYSGGAPSQITHLRALELMDKGDTGRWRALEIIPTKADYVLDLIRAQ